MDLNYDPIHWCDSGAQIGVNHLYRWWMPAALRRMEEWLKC